MPSDTTWVCSGAVSSGVLAPQLLRSRLRHLGAGRGAELCFRWAVCSQGAAAAAFLAAGIWAAALKLHASGGTKRLGLWLSAGTAAPCAGLLRAAHGMSALEDGESFLIASDYPQVERMRNVLLSPG